MSESNAVMDGWGWCLALGQSKRELKLPCLRGGLNTCNMSIN